MAAVRAALVTPLSGPLAGYGRCGATALALWAEEFAAPDRVSLEAVDAHPDARAAVRRAESLRPELVFGPYGSRPAADVAAATSRLVWNHGGARITPRANVVSVLAAAHTYFTGAVELLHGELPQVRTIGVLHGRTGFARGVAGGAAAEAARHGLGARLAVLPAEPPQADALLVAGRFEDEPAVARTADRGRWRVVGFVAAGVAGGTRRVGRRPGGPSVPGAMDAPDRARAG